MPTLTRTSLNTQLNYKGKTYILVSSKFASKDIDPLELKGSILVKVLSHNLKGKLDLHGKPYQPTEWIFKPEE